MKEIIVNVDNYNENSIKTIEGDNLSEVYKIYICKNKRRIDLTNKIAIMAYVNEYRNKKSNILALNITNASQGEIELPITNVISSENGVYACQIAIYGENNSLEQTAPFSLIVENNIFSKISNAAINSSDFHILSEAIKTANAYGEKLKQGTENIELQYANKLNEKMNRDDVLSMANMGQDVKEAMTGGSVAVVGKNTILNENIVDNQIDKYKVDFITKGNNLIRKNNLNVNKSLNPSNGSFIEQEGTWATDYIEVKPNTLYYFRPNTEPGCHICLYDENKRFLKYEFINAGSNVTTLENSKFIAIAFPYYSLEKAEKAFLSNYKDEVYGKLKDEFYDLDFINKSLKDIEPYSCTFFDKIINIINKKEFEKDKTLNPDNNKTEFFKGRTYVGEYVLTSLDYLNLNFNSLLFYCNDQNRVIKDISQGNVTNSGVIKIPREKTKEKIKTVKIIALTTDDSILNSLTITPCQYPYSGTDNYYLKDKYFLSNKTFYTGKKITCFGDSITAQNQWQPWVGKYFDCTMINKGVGGTTVFNNGNREEIEGEVRDSWMCSDDRINLIPKDSDVILIFGGHNDWGYSNLQMGTLGDGNLIDSTFKSSYSLMLKKIVNRFPKAKIITMTPVGGRTEHEVGNSDKQYYIRNLCMTDFANAVKEVSAYYGIPCIDINAESGISTLNHNTYIRDVIHPNAEGGKLIANMVINGMKRFEPIVF
ncbi:TPA: SGNH/GDSL hydrolase family protein [Clostridium perfringens]|nr:SGNH/GDSL hydrolase family protein [Clostridium perfringens]